MSLFRLVQHVLELIEVNWMSFLVAQYLVPPDISGGLATSCFLFLLKLASVLHPSSIVFWLFL